MIKSTAKLLLLYPVFVCFNSWSSIAQVNQGFYKITILIPAAAAFPSIRAQSWQFGFDRIFGNGFGNR